MNNEAIEAYLKIFSDNPYYQAAIAVLAGLVLAKILNTIFSRIIQQIANRTQSHLDDQLIIIAKPALFYTVLLISLGIAAKIIFEDQGENVSHSVLNSIAVLIWSTFAIRLSRVLLRSISQNPNHIPVISTQTLPLFLNLVVLVILIAAVYLIFSAWHIDMTAWLASAGIVGIAVGFAAKDTLANLFAGVFILADAPYKIGDFIVLDTGERGEVTHIGIRSTRILTRDDVEVTIPNSIMGNTKIINESGGPHKKFRIRLQVGVAYGSDIDQVKQVLMQAAADEEEICADPEPRVRFRNFGGSSLDFELLGWVNEPVLRGRVLDSLYGSVYKRFQQENIEIPYSKQDLYIKELPEKT